MAGAPKKRAVKRPPTKKAARTKETAETTRSRPSPPKGSAAKVARGTRAVSKEPAPTKATPKKTTPKKTTAKKTTRKKTAPKETAPKRPALEKAAAGAKERSATGKPKASGAKRARAAAEPATRAPERRRAKERTPSDRVVAVFAELPTERSLTDEEREAMSKVSEAARRFVSAEGPPSRVVAQIARFAEEVRRGEREEPKSQDVRLGLGVLWGEQLEAQAGWSWVHLTYPDGFASYALVPDDRSFACFPLNRVPEALRPDATDTSAHVFDAIQSGSLPAPKPNAYLVLG